MSSSAIQNNLHNSKRCMYYILKILKKIYGKFFKTKKLSIPQREENHEIISEMIYEKLMDNNPCMIARFGSTELINVVNYLGVKNQRAMPFSYIKGDALPWWWEKASNQ